ncbi:uncharacterized protein Hap1MRO34_023699 [Clarias gariepinus]
MKISTTRRVLFYFLTLLSFGSSSASNILYNVTVVKTNITELSAVAQADGVVFFFYPADSVGDDWVKSRVQRVEGHREDLTTFLPAIISGFNHTEGSLQWFIECDGINATLTTTHMKYISGNHFITFHLKNESWTLSDPQAAVIRSSLDPKYAQDAKTILQEECLYWHEQYTIHKSKGVSSTYIELDGQQSASTTTDVTPGTSKNKTDADNNVSSVVGAVFGVLLLVVGAVIVIISCIIWYKNSSSVPTPGARCAPKLIYKVCEQMPRRDSATEGYNCV